MVRGPSEGSTLFTLRRLVVVDGRVDHLVISQVSHRISTNRIVRERPGVRIICINSLNSEASGVKGGGPPPQEKNPG
jgi:hypothetical protein